jgi:hypothetical protein
MRTALIALILMTATAHADSNELWFGGGSRALRSTSADAVTSDSLGIGALGYEHALPVDIPRIALWAEAGFAWGSADGTMFQALTTHLSTQMFVVGARAHYRLHRLVDVTTRLDLGTARTALWVNNASDAGWAAVAQSALGVDLFASRQPAFGIGVRAELGYTITSSVALTPHSDQSSDTLQLKMADASIGHLDLSGPWFAVSLIGAF